MSAFTISSQGPNDPLANALAMALSGTGRDILIQNALAQQSSAPAGLLEVLGRPMPRPAPNIRVASANELPGTGLPGSFPVPRSAASPPPARMDSRATPTGARMAQPSLSQPSTDQSQNTDAPQAQPRTQIVEVPLPDGSLAEMEFPADTPDEVIKSALQRWWETTGQHQQGPSGHNPDQAAALERAKAELARRRAAQSGSMDQAKAEQARRQGSSYEDIMAKAREAHEAGNTEDARRLVQIAVQRRRADEASGKPHQPTPAEGPWTKYQQAAPADGPWTKYQPPLQEAERPSGPQIIGGVVMPPAYDQQSPAQPARMGAKDYIRHGSDMAGDALAAGAAGLSRGVTGMLDLPGMIAGGATSLATAGLENAGVMSPEFGQGVRDSMGMMPWGDGNLFRGGAAAATGGASEFRGDTRLGKYASTAGEFIPGVVATGGPGVGNMLRYGVLPAFASETAGQLTEGTAAEPWARAGAALLAAPLANLTERGIRRAISPYGGADQGRLALAQVLDDAGVPVSAGQRVGSEALRRKEGMSAAGQSLNEAQREALTQAALRTAGTDASRATPEVLAETAKRIGSVFDDVARGVDVTPDPATVTALASANETYRQLAPKGTQAPIIGEVVKRMTAAFRTNQAIPASTVNSWRANLSKLTTSSDGATRAAAIEALGALDEALASTLASLGRADDVARLATAREQWRNFLAIQKAATSAGEGAAAGILSPSALRSAVVQQGRSSYAQGTRGDLGNLARAAEGVIKPLPSSGTAENIRALGIPALGWTSAGAGLGAALGGGPVGAMLGSMAGAAGPAVAGAARMSRPVQSWLANQAVGPGGSILPVNALAPLPGLMSVLMGDPDRR